MDEFFHPLLVKGCREHPVSIQRKEPLLRSLPQKTSNKPVVEALEVV
jgi:hypothetical protein